MTQDFEARLAAILENNAPLDIKDDEKRTKDLLKLVATTCARNSERQQQEQERQQRRKREAASLAEQLAADPFAEDADPAAQQERLEEMQRQVDKELGDVDDLGEEPELYTTVVRTPQVLPPLKLDQLLLLQHTLSTLQLITDSSSSSSTKALEAAFTWLLRGTFDHWISCPDAQVAEATFQAVCFGSRELSYVAYNRFLAWCGMSEAQRGYPGSDVTEEAWVSELDSSQPGLSGIPCRSEQQQQPTITWLPSADDFVNALHALGCRTAPAEAGRSTSSRRSSTPQQQQQQQDCVTHAPVTNLKLLLQLLAHTCRLQAGEAARLPYSLGNGVHGAAGCTQLAVQLMSLMLDEQLAAANFGHVLSEALGWLIAAVGVDEWTRFERRLLEVLSRGLGPSDRSLLHVLTQLPLTARGASLRQLAALQLLKKLTQHSKKQAAAAGAPQAFSSPRGAQRELVKLLGQAPSRALLSSLKIKSKDVKTQQDTWALLDLLGAAHLVLWTDMIRTGGGVGDDIIAWFIKWTETLERNLENKLTSHRVRNALTQLANAYRFWGSTNLSSVPGGGDEDMIEGEDDEEDE